MAIRAKQLQIPLVGRPVLKSSRPSILSVFRANLFGWVDVVNIKGAEIGEAALNALSAKLKNQRQLALPISRAFVNSVPVLIPEVFHARRGAKPVSAFLPAGFAFPMLTPPVREIARLTAKLSAFVLGDRLPAMLASIHGSIITKYFEIACERIENAQRQGRLIA